MFLPKPALQAPFTQDAQGPHKRQQGKKWVLVANWSVHIKRSAHASSVKSKQQEFLPPVLGLGHEVQGIGGAKKGRKEKEKKGRGKERNCCEGK